MLYSPTIEKLIQSLKYLPGVGNKSAQRLAFYLLENNTDEAMALSKSITEAVESVSNCQKCNILTEDPVCQICESKKIEHHILCIVESPSDVLAIEQSGMLHGIVLCLNGPPIPH